MAYAEPVSTFFLSFVLLFLFLFSSPSHSTSDNDDAAAASKVNLSLYYESLCPYCENFIVNQLQKVFESDLISIINLRLVPWGNAQRITNTNWTCQHGPNECKFNTIEACAIYLWPAPEVHFRLIHCIERLSLEGRQNQWQSCLGRLQLNQELMNHCYSSATGTELELRHAYETEHLQPPHRFVPWVLVNNKTLEQDYGNYIAHVCQAYTGRNRPAACNRPPEISSSEIANSVPQVCYPRKSVNLTSLPPEEEKAGSAKDSPPHRKKKQTPT